MIYLQRRRPGLVRGGDADAGTVRVNASECRGLCGGMGIEVWGGSIFCGEGRLEREEGSVVAMMVKMDDGVAIRHDTIRSREKGGN